MHFNKRMLPKITKKNVWIPSKCFSIVSCSPKIHFFGNRSIKRQKRLKSLEYRAKIFKCINWHWFVSRLMVKITFYCCWLLLLPPSASDDDFISIACAYSSIFAHKRFNYHHAFYCSLFSRENFCLFIAHQRFYFWRCCGRHPRIRIHTTIEILFIVGINLCFIIFFTCSFHVAGK